MGIWDMWFVSGMVYGNMGYVGGMVYGNMGYGICCWYGIWEYGKTTICGMVCVGGIIIRDARYVHNSCVR